MNYEDKKALRIERLEKAARLAKTESLRMDEQTHKMSDIIPFGQPILVGHHSESRDRNYRNRLQRRWEKAQELREKAEYYQQKALSAKNNNAISSDDENASDKIKEKISKLEEMQNKFKIINRAIRLKDDKPMKEIGLNDEQIAKLKEPDFCGRVGIPSYQLTNNNANINRLKKRLEQIQANSNDKTTEKEIAGVKIIDNVEENRLQLFFPGKPRQDIINELKSSGFHWAHYSGCWQRMRSNAATYQSKRIAELLLTIH